MNKLLATLACLAVALMAGALYAQAPQPTITSNDASKTDAHDRPIGHVKIRLPAPAGGTGDTPAPPPEPPVTPPAENEDIPPSETPPDGPPAEEPPTYFGEPVKGKFAYLLDASGTMGGSQIATVRAESTATITALTEDDEFDCVAYGDQFGIQMNYSNFLWGALMPATGGNKGSAIAWVNGPATNPGGGTPTYACLKKSCETYPADLTKMFLLTDGSPNTSGSAAQILADFPIWWEKFEGGAGDEGEGTTLVCICIGGSGPAMQFMQSLAALAGGVYISA
jgi:hypothetical protein